MTAVEMMARAYWARWQEEWTAIGSPKPSVPNWDDAPMGARAATMRCMADALQSVRVPTERMEVAGILANSRLLTAAVFTAMIDEAIAEHSVGSSEVTPKQADDGTWMVVYGGEIIASGLTNAQAWRVIERYHGEPVSVAEKRSQYGVEQFLKGQ